MTILQARQLTAHQKETILSLWNNEYPARLQFHSPADLDAYLAQLAQSLHYFAVDEHNTIAAWAFAFERDKETWLALIVGRRFQQQGIGSQLLALIKKQHHPLNGWVIDHNRDKKVSGENYISPLGFYLRHGFVLCNERLETDTISAVKITWK